MGPKILFLDLERFPNLARVWTLYEANALESIEESILCCFSAKWYGGEQITKALPDYKAQPNDDSKLVKELWKLVNEADIVVAHNGKRADFGWLNARFAKYGLQPPSPYQKVDTCEIAKRIFGFEANSLDYLCQYLKLGQKKKVGYELWQQCMANNTEAWRLMRLYNSNDTLLLEKLYLYLLPWMDRHPNVSLWTGKCPKCGSEKLQSRGWAITSTRRYRRYCCTDCGGWSKDTKKFESTSITHA